MSHPWTEFGLILIRHGDPLLNYGGLSLSSIEIFRKGNLKVLDKSHLGDILKERTCKQILHVNLLLSI